MIFVTVGTERFPFDRLVEAMDRIRPALEPESCFMQIGGARYKPDCPHERLMPFETYREHIERARIVVAHAGAGTLLMCAAAGKVPIMVPRLKRHGEHVDDHQLMLARRMAALGRLLLVEDVADLAAIIGRFEALAEEAVVTAPRKAQLVGHLSTLLDDVRR